MMDAAPLLHDDADMPLISWQAFHEAARDLIAQIRESRIKFDRIIAIPRGGLVLGTMLSHAFAVPLVVRDHPEATDPPACLVVDDHAISGDTLQRFSGGRFAFAVIVKHPEAATLSPFFAAHESDMMFRFPWEAEAPNVEFDITAILVGD